MPAANQWASDALISMPLPIDPSLPGLIGVGAGWVMTAGGIAHDLDEATWEALATPSFSPLLTGLSRWPDHG